MKRPLGLPSLLLLALFAGCTSAGPPRRFARLEGMPMRDALFVSPAGQPFHGTPGEPRPIEMWFHQADADGDGAISFAEFQADFRHWFAQLDTNGDGEIDPAEVNRYETQIFPEISSFRAGGGFGVGQGGMRRGPRGGGRGGGRRGWGGRRGGGPADGMGMAVGATRFGLLPIPHPIMDADLDMNRGVSRDEFDHAAASRFTRLDEAHNGRLTLPALEARMRPNLENFRGRRGRGRGHARAGSPPESGE